eukprot:TRINITY_DN30388_c0_g2_i1.p1 TRINITY_DN30388_c0_g2~~TRINITY_DN30388_c0_g2_i1.p1  ORF type:complete len:275 (+),score=23.56 TRINITY_DN30388_c0_g2_i1:83-907(+)
MVAARYEGAHHCLRARFVAFPIAFRLLLSIGIEHVNAKGVTHEPSAVILLHGSGDSGRGLHAYIKNVDGGALQTMLASHGVHVRYPDSGKRPYTLVGGKEMSVWYDRTGLPPTYPEETTSVEQSVKKLLDIVEEIHAKGMPSNRILIGGFSMGGGIALQFCLRHPDAVGACFVLSSFMTHDAVVYRTLSSGVPNVLPKILMMHGEADTFILPAWGKSTAQQLNNLRVPVQYMSWPGLKHELATEELGFLKKWICDFLEFRDCSGGASVHDKQDL